MRHTKEDLLLYLVDLNSGVNLKIIVIDLIIVKLFGVCLMVFPSMRKDFLSEYLCSCM